MTKDERYNALGIFENGFMQFDLRGYVLEGNGIHGKAVLWHSSSVHWKPQKVRFADWLHPDPYQAIVSSLKDTELPWAVYEAKRGTFLAWSRMRMDELATIRHAIKGDCCR